MMLKLGALPPSVPPALAPDLSVPVFLFDTIIEGTSGLLDDTLGTVQLASLLDLLVSEGYTVVPVNDLYQARSHGSPLPDQPVALVFSDSRSFLELDLHRMPQLQGLPIDLLLTPEEVLNGLTSERLAELRDANMQIGLRVERLPLSTSAALDRASDLLDRLATINGRQGATALCLPAGLPDAICRAAGFAPILSPSCAQMKLSSHGAAFPTIVCTGAEGLGTAIECLRPAT